MVHLVDLGYAKNLVALLFSHTNSDPAETLHCESRFERLRAYVVPSNQSRSYKDDK
jgi:hypothetical protein